MNGKELIALLDEVELALAEAECDVECMNYHPYTGACTGCMSVAVAARLDQLSYRRRRRWWRR